MNTMSKFRLILLVGWLCPMVWSAAATAQEAEEEAGPSTVDRLAIQQGIVADKYTKLEKLLDDMARIEAISNPRRAALLMQALKQSKEKLTVVKLNSSVRLLNQQQLKRALDNQTDVHNDMKALLELLLSENRSDRLKREQDRIREYIKEVDRILRLQKSVQGRTEGGAESGDMADDQGKIANRTDELAKQIQKNEEGSSSSDGQQGSEGQPQDGQKGEGEKGETEKPNEEPASEGDPKEGEGKPSEGKGKPSDGKGKPSEGEGKPSEGEGKPSGGEGKPSEGKGKPSEGQGKPSDSQGQGEQSPPQDQSSQDDNPVRKRLEAAEERMREAQQKLEEAKRNDAVAEQEKAKEELEKAKAELEKILRQLREEEVERMLALLEGRFRKMLEQQLRIYEDTMRLDKSTDELRRQKESGELAIDERKLVIAADKALNLLLEEGSSIAFPETVSQMRDDMQQVSDRLDSAKVGMITQGIEEDIIASLEEMIEALQKAQQELEEQQQQGQPPPGQPMDMPLVDTLSELKMVRALQMRVNTRTQRYARLLDDMEDPTGQATDQDLQEALTKLADRQESIYRITRDLVLGKNR